MSIKFDSLIGKKVVAISFNEHLLQLKFNDDTLISFAVDGDCCSQSVWYDFIGVKKLLENGPIISAKEIPLSCGDDKKNYQESVACYGIEFVTENPIYGEQTSVASFRNYSNGYYGGDAYILEEEKFMEENKIDSDVLCTDNISDEYN